MHACVHTRMHTQIYVFHLQTYIFCNHLDLEMCYLADISAPQCAEHYGSPAEHTYEPHGNGSSHNTQRCKGGERPHQSLPATGRDKERHDVGWQWSRGLITANISSKALESLFAVSQIAKGEGKLCNHRKCNLALFFRYRVRFNAH